MGVRRSGDVLPTLLLLSSTTPVGGGAQCAVVFGFEKQRWSSSQMPAVFGLENYGKMRNGAMTKKVAELMVETLAEAGIRRVYGLPGDSLNGITDSIRRQKQVQWVH